MIAFPGMLVSHAEAAGMAVPPDPENFDTEEFPHWKVYCSMQLGRPILFNTSHQDNAKIVAGIPENEIREVTPADLLAKGFR